MPNFAIVSSCLLCLTMASPLLIEAIIVDTWCKWSGWSSCSTTCGIGYRSRERVCQCKRFDVTSILFQTQKADCQRYSNDTKHTECPILVTCPAPTTTAATPSDILLSGHQQPFLVQARFWNVATFPLTCLCLILLIILALPLVLRRYRRDQWRNTLMRCRYVPPSLCAPSLYSSGGVPEPALYFTGPRGIGLSMMAPPSYEEVVTVPTYTGIGSTSTDTRPVYAPNDKIEPRANDETNSSALLAPNQFLDTDAASLATDDPPPTYVE